MNTNANGTLNMSYVHGLDLAPSQARFLEINANTYDVQISDMDIFTK